MSTFEVIIETPKKSDKTIFRWEDYICKECANEKIVTGTLKSTVKPHYGKSWYGKHDGYEIFTEENMYMQMSTLSTLIKIYS